MIRASYNTSPFSNAMRPAGHSNSTLALKKVGPYPPAHPPTYTNTILTPLHYTRHKLHPRINRRPTLPPPRILHPQRRPLNLPHTHPPPFPPLLLHHKQQQQRLHPPHIRPLRHPPTLPPPHLLKTKRAFTHLPPPRHLRRRHPRRNSLLLPLPPLHLFKNRNRRPPPPPTKRPLVQHAHTSTKYDW